MTKAGQALSAMLLLGSVLSMAVPASAHGAAPALPYMTRLLADYNDDWLGVQDGHNLVALDAYPQYNATLGDVLVLRLIMNGGWAPQSAATGTPALAEHVTFKANGQDKEFAFTTEDNLAFASEVGFDAVRGPFPQMDAAGAPDGERFFVEGLATFASLAVKPGDALSDWLVTGEAGDSEGDVMPQGQAPGVPETCGGALACVAYDIGSYTLPGLDAYATASAPATIPRVPAVGEATFNLTIANLVNSTAQSVMVMAMGEGVAVSFDGVPVSADAMGMLDLQGSASGSLQVHVARLAPFTGGNHTGNHTGNRTAGHGDSTSNATAATHSEGTVTFNVTTSLGGHQVLVVALQIEPSAAPMANETLEHDHDHDNEGNEKDSPGLGLLLLIAALACIVVALRRRR
jgi:hypothetical protein